MDKFIMPNAIRDAGLTPYEHNFEVGDKTRDYIIENYARDAGCRSLKKFSNRICEKVAFKLVEAGVDEMEDDDHFHISIEHGQNLETFIGPPLFQSKKFYNEFRQPPGVVIGLAYNSMGGSILYIEASKASFGQDATNGTLKVTGSLGNVMQESSSIAQTYTKSFLSEHFHEDKLELLTKQNIHIHFPEGAIPKDGPSAGITITTALVGLSLGLPTIPNIGMTGELSLNGKVLPIGGVKEKTMAASREGLTTLIFPKGNMKDVQKLPDALKSGIKFHFVGKFEEAFNIIYPDVELNQKDKTE